MPDLIRTLPHPITAASREHPAPRTTFFGWRVVGATFVLASFGWGVGFYGPPIFLHAVQHALGLSLPLVSAAVTAHFLVGAIAIINLPRLYAHFGVGPVTKTGAIALGLGVVGWALAREPWQLFLATMLSGSGWIAMGAAAVNAILAPWFVSKRPAALAMAYNGASVGGVLFSPLWVLSIEHLGFPLAATAIAVVMAFVVWLLADLYFAHTPAGMRQVPDGEADLQTTSQRHARAVTTAPPGSALWRHRPFLTLAAAMALSLFAQIGMIAHLYSLLVPSFGIDGAGLAMGSATAVAVLGRTVVGWTLPPTADRRLIACASYAVQICGALALLAADGSRPMLLGLGVLLFGAGIGNTTSLPPLIAQSEFAHEDLQRVVARIVALSQAAYAFAPAALGLVRDLSSTGTADSRAPWFFVSVALLQALAIVAMMLGRRRRTG